ncbi:putative nacht domain protein [Phaeoacremonium minimum UCRPA7]|uniref:Putative nacht domain protein n=1 Tax=Phaeoacremonium minimum (strain UCR-PA7) TaxID=1286976 RepID=R8BT67_PHAM7|nr:putative nacht domain protein [Phaeoacremonium minimum UCRPA7]EOO02494.1 putative nacht domain protein [Phaeoacremonium minimum UCRPA7]
MEAYGKVIEVFLNSSDYLAFVWAACNFSEAFNSLMDAYLQIGELLPQLQVYQQHSVSNPYMRTVLALMYKDILEFHRVALKYFRKSNWYKLFDAVWSAFLVKLRELKEKMERHKHLIESQASIVQFEEAQKFREIVEANFKELQTEFDRQPNSMCECKKRLREFWAVAD